MEGDLLERLRCYCIEAPHDELAVASLFEIERLLALWAGQTARGVRLESAAERVLATWHKLGECEEEFERDAPDACAEWRDTLDSMIIGLDMALRSARAALGEVGYE